MTFKSILVPVLDAESSRAPLALGADVAVRFGAHLEALHITYPWQTALLQIPGYAVAELPRYAKGPSPEETAAAVQRRVEQTAKEARSQCDTMLEQANIPYGEDPAPPHQATASWREVSGPEQDAIVRNGVVIDLLVAGLPGQQGSGAMQQIVETALFVTARPVLLAPPKVTSAPGGKVLVAWNQTLQSMRALNAALPFLEKAEKVMVYMVETGAKAGPAPETAARYLAWHGIAADVKRTAPGYPSVGEQILVEATQIGADLLVMGAYSHSRIRELLLGGVTRHILKHADIPVFMAH